MTEETPIYDRNSIEPDNGNWKTYRKHALTKAIRLDGPFIVETSEGTMRCNDGYLAVDARGYPYPIAADEFEKIYEEEVETSKSWSINKEGVLLDSQKRALLVCDIDGNELCIKRSDFADLMQSPHLFLKIDYETIHELEMMRSVNDTSFSTRKIRKFTYDSAGENIIKEMTAPSAKPVTIYVRKDTLRNWINKKKGEAKTQEEIFLLNSLWEDVKL